ncbi:hypothetical protein BDM02DRAFT_3189367 [Thelephora ganbajun]|uniref:Uncharacterized protein n=1 Tax=Thelephora ganbajun TaxID=370292 RepID=A0ACB6Z9M8_THEGA|nr:hypothetical protein BDM02DRAFT_3189367 [Thelephora ganbajun]
MWLFSETSLKARLAFMQYASLTATSYRWVVGTMFVHVCYPAQWLSPDHAFSDGVVHHDLKTGTCIPSEIYLSDPHLPTSTNPSRARLYIHSVAVTAQVETEIGTALWKWLPKMRVLLYMLGERHPAEVASKGFSGFWFKNAIVRGVRATVELTEDGQPIDEAEVRPHKLQYAGAEPHKRNVNEDCTIVDIPLYFKYRIVTFILTVLSDLPAIHCSESPQWALVHCWLIAQAIERLDRHRQRRENEPRAWWPLFLAKHNSLWLAQAPYMVSSLAFAIPTLIALVVEKYVLLLVKLVHNPKLAVKVKSVEIWILGLFPTKTILGFLFSKHRDAWTKESKEESSTPHDGNKGHRSGSRNGQGTLIYRGVFTGVGVVRGILELHDAYLKWSQTVRDKAFLVEMRLRNLEPEETMEEPVEKKGEQEQEEAGIRDLQVLDPIDNQSDEESYNEERFLL